jgi:hypothetical protein
MEMGRSAVEGAVVFATEVGVDECMLVGGMQLLARFEDMKLVGGIGVGAE